MVATEPDPERALLMSHETLEAMSPEQAKAIEGFKIKLKEGLPRGMILQVKWTPDDGD